jgi:hypothetical protein
MKRFALALVAAACLCLPAAAAWTPPDIAAYAARRAQCDHWGGEEPYDKARAAEINRAVARLRCRALDADEKRLLARYRSTPAFLKQIRAARQVLL